MSKSNLSCSKSKTSNTQKTEVLTSPTLLNLKMKLALFIISLLIFSILILFLYFSSSPKAPPTSKSLPLKETPFIPSLPSIIFPDHIPPSLLPSPDLITLKELIFSILSKSTIHKTQANSHAIQFIDSLKVLSSISSDKLHIQRNSHNINSISSKILNSLYLYLDFQIKLLSVIDSITSIVLTLKNKEPKLKEELINIINSDKVLGCFLEFGKNFCDSQNKNFVNLLKRLPEFNKKNSQYFKIKEKADLDFVKKIKIEKLDEVNISEYYKLKFGFYTNWVYLILFEEIEESIRLRKELFGNSYFCEESYLEKIMHFNEIENIRKVLKELKDSKKEKVKNYNREKNRNEDKYYLDIFSVKNLLESFLKK